MIIKITVFYDYNRHRYYNITVGNTAGTDFQIYIKWSLTIVKKLMLSYNYVKS